MCAYLEGRGKDGTLKGTPSSYGLVQVQSSSDLTFEGVSDDVLDHGDPTTTTNHLHRVDISQGKACVCGCVCFGDELVHS